MANSTHTSSRLLLSCLTRPSKCPSPASACCRKRLRLSSSRPRSSTSAPRPRLPRRLQSRISTPPSLTRTYYTPSADDSTPPFPPTETAILTAALHHLPTHGFTTTTLRLGSRDAGYLPASTNLFPAGAFDLLRFWLTTQRLHLATLVLPHPRPTTPAHIQHNVKALLLVRLRANVPLVPSGALAQALALVAQPTHAPAAVAELASLADDILNLAGFTELGPSWYARRVGVSAVYAASEVSLCQMKGADVERRWADVEGFVDRRLQEGEWLSAKLRSWGEYGLFWGMQGVGVLRSLGMRI